MSLAKPQMKGLLNSYLRRHLVIGLVLSLSCGVAWKYMVLEERKKSYANFYKNYDAHADFIRMKNLGLFQSCGPDD